MIKSCHKLILLVAIKLKGDISLTVQYWPFNPIHAGGGEFDPPLCSFFLHNSKSIGLRLLKFSDFSYIPKALPLGLEPGFNCLSPQAHCLNDCFFPVTN